MRRFATTLSTAILCGLGAMLLAMGQQRVAPLQDKAKPADKAKPDSTKPPDKVKPDVKIDRKPDELDPVAIKKAEQLEAELLKRVFSDLGTLPRELRETLREPMPEVAKIIGPLSAPLIKPVVITAGDVDGFNYGPNDKTTPCCVTGVKPRDFDEGGVNKVFAHLVRIPCCKVLAVRFEVRVRNEGELAYNDGLYIAIPGKSGCSWIWGDDYNIRALDKGWPQTPSEGWKKKGYVTTLSGWLPQASVTALNRYIFENPGCDCQLCLESQDDHAVDYWRLYIYCCSCPPLKPVGGQLNPLPEGSGSTQ